MEEILDDGNDGKPEFLTPALPRSFASHSRIERILTLHSNSGKSRIYQEYIKNISCYDTYTGPCLVILPITVKRKSYF